MAIPYKTIIEAASRAYSPNSPIMREKIHHRLEWLWGLGYGMLEGHLHNFFDPELVEILLNENLVLFAQPELVREIFLLTSNIPSRSSKRRRMVQDLYEGRDSFEYLVLPVDPSSETTPRVLISSVPPHLTICSSVGKLIKRWGYGVDRFHAVGNLLITLVKTSAAGATLVPTRHTFIYLRYIHESWATCYVPPGFLGLEEPCGGEESDDSEDEESDEDARSSTMEWELSDEPKRRLLPHEFEQEAVLKFPILRSADGEDDAISCDSHITGVEDMEEFAKASLARGDYVQNREWLEGMQSWVAGAVHADLCIVPGQMEDDSIEQPRAPASLDLDRPDYLFKHLLRSKT
ncbi:hypothetical protein B0H11DRAFT_934111 [Mycena galericulata]|nr:hypothetical protein B0H11DRAFT_934111 [Mycena galericulata]